MKKKTIAVLMMLAAIIAVLASGCAGGVSESDYNSVVSKLNQAEARIAALEAELAAAEEQLTGLEEALEIAAEERDQAEARLDVLQDEINSLEELITSLQEESALYFIKTSPTFAFDGIEDTLDLVGTEEMAAPQTARFTFEFNSRYAGYGDRSGEHLLPVITPHTAVIIVEQDEIKSAVLDGEWNMLAQAAVSNLEGITWLLTSCTGDMGTREVLDNTEVTLVFGTQAGQLGGFAGCNHYGAPYEIDGSNLTLTDNITQTLILCSEEIMEQENNFLEALKAAETFILEDDNLTITGGGWTLSFEKQP